MKKYASFSLVLLVLLISSCKTSQIGMIVGDNYDERKNQTVLTLLPYGSIVIPEKWTKTSYNKVSKQHFFTNSDSITIAVALNPKASYPFYKEGQSDRDYLLEFTKWESEFFKSQGAITTILDEQTDKGYVLWKASIPAEKINQIYLYGLKQNRAYNLSGNSVKWTEDQAKEFLIRLFNDN